MKIVIDTNAIYKDYYLEKTHIKLLLENKHLVPAEVYIPDVVVDEIVNQYKEELFEVINQYNTCVKKIKNLKKDLKRKSLKVNTEVEDYKKCLKEKLSKFNVDILQYPEIKHKELVKRDLQRKKPFKRDGSGYRDALIWENIKRLSVYGRYEVLFITANSKDFGDGEYISDEYLKEVHNIKCIKIIKSIKEFNENYIIPKLENMDILKDELNRSKIYDFDINNWIENRLLDVLRDYELKDVVTGIEGHYGSFWFSKINEYKEIEILDIKEIAEEKKLIKIKLCVNVDYDIDADQDDFYHSESIREYFGNIWGQEDFSVSVTSTDDFEIEILIITEDGEIISEDLVTFNGNYGLVEFN